MKAVSNNIIVIDEEGKEKTSQGGIILTSTENFRVPVCSKVAYIGPDVKTVTVGDIVYYTPHCGEAVKIEDVTYRVFDENSVLLIV